MGTQKHRIVTLTDEESILHLTCWVFRREIESLENMPVILYLRTFCNIISEFAEYAHDFLTCYRHRMTWTKSNRITWHRVVKWSFPRLGGFRHRPLEFLNLGCGSILQDVEFLSELLFKLRRNGPELLKKTGHFSFLSQKADPGLFYLLFSLAW